VTVSPAGQAHVREPLSIAVELRATRAGDVRHSPVADHHLSIHAGEPVRVSCHSNRVLSLRTRGEINLMPAGISDDWVEDDASSSLELLLPAALVRAAAADMGLDPDRAVLEPRFHFRDPQIEHIGWALEADARSGFPGGRLYRDSLGMALAIHLLGRHEVPAPPPGGLSQRQLRVVVEYIEEHLDRDLSLARLARVAGVSASHLKTLFKRSTGQPVHTYVVQQRVHRAATLLARGELPASQIALETGFSHQSHMARCMRRVLGVTPGAVARSRAGQLQ
jgi:AraC family transcriptional regulator